MAATPGDLPASTRAQRDLRTPPAPVYKSDAGANGQTANTPSSGEGELARLLAAFLQQGVGETEMLRGGGRGKWGRRRVLVCTAPTRREELAHSLTRSNYEVFVAEDKGQAVERMREDRIDVIILDGEFDFIDHGAAFVVSQINMLRPAQRRRLFLVQLSATERTADAHAAFLNHINLIVNTSDIEDLPPLLERAIRDHNDLYRNLNKALQLSDL